MSYTLSHTFIPARAPTRGSMSLALTLFTSLAFSHLLLVSQRANARPPSVVSSSVSSQPSKERGPSPIQLAPARRVFSADLDRDGSDELLIAHNAQLSAWRWSGASWDQLWSTEGPGVAQLILTDSRAPKVWVAWGMGRGKMQAPITVSALDPLSGAQRQVWSYKGGRSQVVSMEWVEVDQDPEPELMIAHFVNKYHTRRVILDQLTASAPVEDVTAQIRMGTSWALANLDQSLGLEEVIGRVYGDAKGEYGDLSVRPFKRDRKALSLDQVIATERGVKHLAYLPEVSEGLLFSDGWVAAYGKKAKAKLKRLRWLEGRPVVDHLATSPNEFTFFRLWSRRDPVQGKHLLFAQGNKGLNVITPQAQGPWRVTQVLKTPPIVNIAVGYVGGEWWAFTPHESGAQAHRFTLPTAP